MCFTEITEEFNTTGKKHKKENDKDRAQNVRESR